MSLQGRVTLPVQMEQEVRGLQEGHSRRKAGQGSGGEMTCREWVVCKAAQGEFPRAAGGVWEDSVRCLTNTKQMER